MGFDIEARVAQLPSGIRFGRVSESRQGAPLPDGQDRKCLSLPCLPTFYCPPRRSD